jgi:pimeloyl-ACP methyl ester carboxylesterase
MIDTGEVRLHVVRAGPEKGIPIVLLHGFPEFWFGWREQIGPLAAAGYRVLIPDQRGYNSSDKPRPVRAYCMLNLVADVSALLDHENLQSANLVGHDWGAAVAWHMAMRHPERVVRLAILNVPHPAVMRSQLRSNWRQLLRSWYIFFFQLPWLPEALLRVNHANGLARLLAGSSKRGSFSAHDLDHYREAWLQPGAVPAMLGWYRAALRYPGAVFLERRVPHPTLILWGARDDALELAMAEDSLTWCDQGRLEIFPEATHWVQHDQAEAVNRSLLEFLAA